MRVEPHVMALSIGTLECRALCVLDRTIQRFAMDRDDLRVGRSPMFEIALDDPCVGRGHCRLVRRDGRFVIVDDLSPSGTYLNGEQVREAELHVGDMAKMGRTVMAFEHRSGPDVDAEIHPLLAAVCADPADEASRLVYADWLSDRDDPRGTFIQYQLEAERLPTGDPRRVEMEAAAQMLLERYEHAWVKPLPVFVERWRFRGGFLAAVQLDARVILDGDGFAALRRVHPIRAVSVLWFTVTSEVLEELVLSRNLDGIRQVEFDWWRDGEPGGVHPGLAARFGCGEQQGIYGPDRSYFGSRR